MNKLSAPLNKVSALLPPHLCSNARRPKITWDFVLQRRIHLSLAMAVSTKGAPMPAGMTQILGPMMLKSLKEAIERVCPNWQVEGKSLTLACDELSMLVSDDSESIVWFREKGREFGIRVIILHAGTEPVERRRSQQLPRLHNCHVVPDRQPKGLRRGCPVLDDGTSDWNEARFRSIAKWCVAVKTRGEDGPLPCVVVRGH